MESFTVYEDRGPLYPGWEEEKASEMKEILEIIEEKESQAAEAEKKGLIEKAMTSRRNVFEKLKDIADISPNFFINSLNELTESERRLLIKAVAEPGRIVSLPRFVSYYLGGRNPYYQNKHAGEVDAKRAAQRLWNRGLASIVKIDGLNYCKVDEQRVREVISRELHKRAPTPEDIYLIKGTCKIQTSDSRRKSGPIKSKVLELPKNCSGMRLGACRLLKGIQWMSDADKKQVASYYTTYVNDINEKVIALLDGKSDTLIGMEYSTRFNDFNKAKRNLDKFEAVMKASFNLNNKGRKAVFLTLTSDPNLTDEEFSKLQAQRLKNIEKKIASSNSSDKYLKYLIDERYKILGPDAEISDLEKVPIRTKDQEKRLAELIKQRELAYEILDRIRQGVGKRTLEKLNHQLSTFNRLERHYDPEGHQSLWDTNRSFSVAWNSFLSYLKKRLGKRPQYVCAFEYTDTGLLHCHAIIIVPYLLDIHEINIEWERLGQGKIGYIYGLKAVKRDVIEDGKHIKVWEWKWSNPMNKPRDCKEKHGGAYLEKYLKKAAFAQSDRYESPAMVHSPYWSFNKRFWTCSQKLRQEAKMMMDEEEKEKKPNSFRFAGIYDRSVFADMASENDSTVYAYFRFNSPYWSTFHPESVDSEGGG
ncbi:MAG: hypothetical protein IJT54_04175 [Candidatus Methanomethylophilaceae archaeon]|nr:hypothetical protein [Candidatus Methanomethylophilaceae archaeon]